MSDSGNNKTLKSINASGHAVPSSTLEKLGSAITSQNENGITCIAIGDENMGDDGVESFCTTLKDVQGGSLVTVDFALKSLSKEGLEVIGRVFGASNNLQNIILARNPKVGDDGLEALCTSAASKTSSCPFPVLKKLDLSDCNIGVKGIESLVTCLIGKEDTGEQRKSRFIDLCLNSNSLGNIACDPLVNLISGSPFQSSILQSLSLKNCSIGDEGVKKIADRFLKHQCGSLKTLDMSNNKIGTKGMKLLASAIKEAKDNISGLKEICLADNLIGEEGVVALADALIQKPCDDGNSTLTSLDLTNTNCGSSGATALINCSSISTLRLFNNKLGSSGFNEISPHLVGGHPNIVNLDLGGNRADGEAVSNLLRYILKDQDNFQNAMRTLELGGNENIDENLFNEVRNKRRELDIPQVKETPKDLPDDEEA